METKSLKIAGLLLDTRNPRNPPVDAQDEAIAALIDEQGPKLVSLMKDIASRGMNPTDRLLVVQDGRRFIVVEGNRRVAALKILDNPDLAAGTPIARQAKRIARERDVSVDKVDCAVAASREDARPWIKLRHDGESEGAGTVRWGGRQRARFGSEGTSQSSVGNHFLNAVERGYDGDDEIIELAEQVGATRLTTLGRVVQGPAFRKWADCIIENGETKFHHDAKAMRPLVQQLLNDLATDYGVTQLKSAEQRTEFVESRLPKPDPAQRLDEPQTLGPAPADDEDTTPKPKPKPPRKPRPEKLFKGLTLNNLGGRIPSLLEELQSMKVEDHPNAANILVRVLLELSIDQAIEQNRWPITGALAAKLRKVLARVDPTHKDNRFQTIRTGLTDNSSLYAVKTLHSYVHNPHAHAGPKEARVAAANIAPFLQALDAVA